MFDCVRFVAVTIVADRIHRRPVAGVTLGAKGFLWVGGDGRLLRMPTPSVRVVDTLSAGDVFHGAFAYAVAMGKSVAAAAELGCVSAALKCSRFGGRSGTPNWSEVEPLLSESWHDGAKDGATARCLRQKL
eukprot:SAG31_NODE_8703_length_1402_cov_1.525710_1_plen_131_part_00